MIYSTIKVEVLLTQKSLRIVAWTKGGGLESHSLLSGRTRSGFPDCGALFPAQRAKGSADFGATARRGPDPLSGGYQTLRALWRGEGQMRLSAQAQHSVANTADRSCDPRVVVPWTAENG